MIAKTSCERQHRSKFDDGGSAYDGLADSTAETIATKLADLELALNLDSTGVVLFDKNACVSYANRAFRKIYKISDPGDMVGLTIKGLAERLSAAGIPAAEAEKCLRPSFGNRQLQNSDYHTVELATGRAVRIRHHSCEHGGWVSRHSIAGDGGARFGLTHELVSFQALIDQVPDYLWVKDIDSRFIVANRSLAIDNGRECSTDLIGLTDFDLHDEAKAGQFHAREYDILSTGNAMIDEEEIIIDAEGKEKIYSSSKIPLRNDDNHIIGLIGVARDITTRKKEETLRQKSFELEEKSRQLTMALEQERLLNVQQRQFVSMASHEFRTPLAVIDAAAQRLVRRKEKTDPQFIAAKVAQIRHSVDRIVELMESILSFEKLEAGKIDIHPADCSLQKLLTDCCGRQQQVARNHHINLSVVDLPETIIGDRSALEQVFTNLLSNAVKYAPGAPDIDVSAWRDGNNIKVSVTDRGLGIDREDLPHMFERYFRARTSSGIAGTGIGLNLVKQIVELHDGRIDVESETHKGTTFTVTLPIKAATSLPLGKSRTL